MLARILLCLAVVTGAALGAGSATAQAEEPPSVTLSAEHSPVKVGETIKLTATTPTSVGPTPYFIRIFNADTYTELKRCGSGTECRFAEPVPWAENEHPSTRHFYAEVSSEPGVPPYTRSEATVPVEAVTFAVSLSSTPATVTVPESYTLKATISPELGESPYKLKIIENGTND